MEFVESLHELAGVGMAPASDTPSTLWLAPHKRGSRELWSRSRPLPGVFSVYLLPCTYLYIRSNVPWRPVTKIWTTKTFADILSGHFTKIYIPENFPLYMYMYSVRTHWVEYTCEVHVSIAFTDQCDKSNMKCQHLFTVHQRELENSIRFSLTVLNVCAAIQQQ